MLSGPLTIGPGAPFSPGEPDSPYNEGDIYECFRLYHTVNSMLYEDDLNTKKIINPYLHLIIRKV